MKHQKNSKCCICEKTAVFQSFVPQVCLSKYGIKAHRICKSCWWDENIGFARENASHKCPGCMKEFSLTKIKNKKTEVIDLTED